MMKFGMMGAYIPSLRFILRRP